MTPAAARRRQPRGPDAGRLPRRDAGAAGGLRAPAARSTPPTSWPAPPSTSSRPSAELPVSVWHVGQAIVGLEERDPEGPVSIVGGGRIAGEVAASDQFVVSEKARHARDARSPRFNLFIGLFNFIPLLPLDGGHIASALWEAATPRHRPAARTARPRLRRRRQAAPRGVRRRERAAGDGAGADRGRHLRAGAAAVLSPAADRPTA